MLLNMSLADLDQYYIKCVSSLHSVEHIVSKEPSVLQLNLEEAIKNKTGVTKDFTPLISCLTNRHVEETRTVVHNLEEIKTASSSDNELELDLFNEDLMCVVCHGMDVAAGNRLLECSDCHSLYHQECHQPPVTSADVEATWTCQSCLDVIATLKETIPVGLSATNISAATLSNTPIKPVVKSPPEVQRSTSSTSLNSYKSSTPKTSSPSKSSKSSSKSSSHSKTSVVPNINIISADKRLQIMKKKAAKLHEKRKQMPR